MPNTLPLVVTLQNCFGSSRDHRGQHAVLFTQAKLVLRDSKAHVLLAGKACLGQSELPDDTHDHAIIALIPPVFGWQQIRKGGVVLLRFGFGQQR